MCRIGELSRCLAANSGVTKVIAVQETATAEAYAKIRQRLAFASPGTDNHRL